VSEEWAPIAGFPRYAVSNWGSVMNTETETILAPTRNREGIAKIGMFDGRHYTTRSIAVLVAKAFVPPDEEWFNAPIHRNGDKMDCHADNLLWRPRWHAVHFHQQFHHPSFHRHVRLENLKTGERYRLLADPCMQYGLRYVDVIMSYTNHEPAFPTGHEYQLL
jgi:NUMOD4 motif-containing protein